MSWRGGTTGRACGCPANEGLPPAGRGAMGAPGVKPGPAGLGGAGRGGIGAPGTDEAAGALGAPGATTWVGGCTRGAEGIGSRGCNTPLACSGVAPGRSAGRSGVADGLTASCGSGWRGPAPTCTDGLERGVGGGSGRAGIDTFRFTGPGVGACVCASGG
ncbi:MAG TPA: hypothetical protein VHZ55_04620 [Bryobacteraceae bacterium]|nr:hypothetical protein [Bryobacteraceae bacterium]